MLQVRSTNFGRAWLAGAALLVALSLAALDTASAQSKAPGTSGGGPGSSAPGTAGKNEGTAAGEGESDAPRETRGRLYRTIIRFVTDNDYPPFNYLDDE